MSLRRCLPALRAWLIRAPRPAPPRAGLFVEALEDRTQPSASPWKPVWIPGGAAVHASGAHDLGPRREIALVEANVGNRAELARELRADGAEVVFLAGGGAEEIARALRGRSGLDAVHLFSHGAAGVLDLGNERLAAPDLAARAEALRAWGAALKPGGDLLLYGCDVAADANGAAFVAGLAAATGADVAASSDRTGAAARGGNYVLERNVGAIETAALAAAGWSAALNTFTVDSVANANTTGTLRWAINQANGNSGQDTIRFAIAGAGVHTIAVGAGGLPQITDEVRIEGFSQGGGGYSGPPLIELNGAGAGFLADGLALAAGSANSQISGLAINRFGGDGIDIRDADDVRVLGNYIGADSAGVLDRGNGFNGVYVNGNADRVRIGDGTVAGRNVISGNDNNGIEFTGPTARNGIVQGNYIGIAADGATALGNADRGIWLEDSGGHAIGGSSASARNVISGNGGAGVGIAGDDASGNVVIGNRIGTNAAGTLAVGNGGAGVQFWNMNDTPILPAAIGDPANNTIGGVNAGEGNAIAFNVGAGVAVHFGAGIAIRGNAIFDNGGLGIDLGNDGVTPNDADASAAGPNNLRNFPVLATATLSGGSVTVAGSYNSVANSVFALDFYASPTNDPSNHGEGKRYLGTGLVTTDAFGNATFNFTWSGPVFVGEWITATAAITPGAGTSEFSLALIVPGLPPLGSPPSGADNIVTTLEDTAYVFQVADFGFDDSLDLPPDAFDRVRIATLPGTGTLTFNGTAVAAGDEIDVSDIAAGLLRFTPATNANGAGYASFTFQVRDSSASNNLDLSSNTITVNVTAVNDPPAGANNAVTTLEDTPYVFAVADFGFSDVDGHGFAGVQVATLPGAGTLRLNGTALAGPTFVTAAQLAAGQLTFTPAANANGAGYASFTFQVRDSSASNNLDLSPNTITVNVTAVNDPPAGANNAVTTLEDTPYVFAVADFGFSDVDGHGFAGVQVATLPGAGTLRLNGTALAGPTFVTAAQLAAGQLTFTPAANANGAGYASFTFQVRDSSGANDPSANTITIDVTAVNDPPAGTNATVTTLEDTPYVFAAADFGFSDADGHTFAGVNVATLPGAGTLRLNGTALAGPTFVTAAQVAAGQLTFTPAANGNGTGYASFTFQVRDSSASNNLDLTPNTITVNVTAVNDSPAGANNAVTTLEDTPYVFAAADFGFSDVDGHTFAGVNVATLPGAGTLRLNGTALAGPIFVAAAQLAAGQLTFTPALNANGAGYASFTFQVRDSSGANDPSANTITVNVTVVNDPPSGTNNTVTTPEDTPYVFAAADFGFSDVDGHTFAGVQVATLPAAGTLRLNGTALAGPTFVTATQLAAGELTFTPAANGNGAGYASFTFQVRDSGGANDPSANTITIDVTAVNDPPAGANNAVTTLEDTPYVFAAADFGFSDVDGHTFAGVQVATLPAAGTLRLNGTALAGPIFVAAAQLAAGQLTFTPALNANGAGYASFAFQVRDSSGANDPSANTITVNVTAVNDPPAGTNNTVTTLEDTPYVFAAADFPFADPGNDPLLAVRISSLPSVGSLRLNGVAMAVGDRVSRAALNAGLLRFLPAANANGLGYSSFTFQVQDNAGTANGGIDLDPTPNAITVNVTAVNDPPAGTNNTVTTLEDTPYVFAAADFGFSDVDGHTFAGVNVATLPGVGTLRLNGTALAGPTFVTATQLAAGQLTFTPAANANGAGYASFTFQVRDSGGATDPGANMITVNVTAVNDPPSGTDHAVATAEDVPLALTVRMFGFRDDLDVPANALLRIRMVGVPSAGTLTLNGVTVAANQFIDVADILAGRLRFAAAANANGAGYARIAFQVEDDGGATNGGRNLDATANLLTINVLPVNDAPVGADGTAALVEDSRRVLTAADFGFDDPLDRPADAFASVVVAGLPAAGALTLNGAAVSAGQEIARADIDSGLLAFAPAADASGVGYARLAFRVRDAGGALSAAANSLRFDVTPAYDPPLAAADAYRTAAGAELRIAGPGVLANDRSPDGRTLAATLVSGPANGALRLQADGGFAYVPNAGFAGADAFSYRVGDGVDFSAATTVSVTVTPDATDPIVPNLVPPPNPTRPPPTVVAPPAAGTPARNDVPATVVSDALPPPANAGGGGGRGQDAPAPLEPPEAAIAPAPYAPPPNRTETVLPAPAGRATAPGAASSIATPAGAANVAEPTAPPALRRELPQDHAVFAALAQAAAQARLEGQSGATAQFVAGGGAAFSAGYALLNSRAVLWLLGGLLARSGSWKRFDPLDVIYAWEKEKRRAETTGDDESLQSMVG